jgi:hypothetical protein
LGETILVIDPSAPSRTHLLTPAPRLASLAGTRIGLLHNGKDNGDVLLRAIGECLQAAGAQVACSVKKGRVTVPASAEIYSQLVATCQAVVTGPGD